MHVRSCTEHGSTGQCAGKISQVCTTDKACSTEGLFDVDSSGLCHVAGGYCLNVHTV